MWPHIQSWQWGCQHKAWNQTLSETVGVTITDESDVARLNYSTDLSNVLQAIRDFIDPEDISGAHAPSFQNYLKWLTVCENTCTFVQKRRMINNYSKKKIFLKLKSG